jgi:hypothetical protein
MNPMNPMNPKSPMNQFHPTGNRGDSGGEMMKQDDHKRHLDGGDDQPSPSMSSNGNSESYDP